MEESNDNIKKTILVAEDGVPDRRILRQNDG